MWQEVPLFLFLNINLIYGKLSGDHICLVEEEFLVNVTETYLRNTTVRHYHWCYNVPPRCSYYTVKQVNDTRVVEKNDTRIVEACCSGFIENEEQCISSCPVCKNGICENGNCNCYSGYKGDTCDLECSNGKWGPHCLKSCNCPNNKCNSKTGNCLEKTTTALSTAAVKKTTTIPIITVSPATRITEKTTYDRGDRGTTIITKINTPKEEITDKIPNGEITISLISSLSAVSTVSSIFNNAKTKEDTITETSTTSPIVQSESTIKNNSTQIIETLIEDSTNIQNFLITIQFNKTNPTEKSNSTSSSESLKEVEVTTKMNEFATNSSVTFLNAPIATHEGLLIPVEIHYDQKQKPTTYGSTTQDKNVVSVTNEEYLNRQISNNFSSNDFALFGITVLMTSMLVVTILSINFLRKKRKKGGTKNEEHQVSVFSASIFHSPLPDPPVTENPLYLNSVKCRKGSLKELSTFETRIVCNVNSTPRSPINDIREFEYDHPPSTGNYRAASLVDPLDAKKSSFQDYVIEPLYDEILQMENEQNSSASSAPMSIYINTCGRTKF